MQYNSNMKVISSDKFDASNITVSSIRQNRNGKNTAYLNYAGVRGRWGLRTPRLRLPFGVEKVTFDDVVKMAMVLSFDTNASSSDVDKNRRSHLLKHMRAIDKVMQDAAKKDPVAWINKAKASDSKIKSQHKACIKEGPPIRDTSDYYSPTLKVKIYMDKDGNPEVKARVKRPNVSRENVLTKNVTSLLTQNTCCKVVIRPGPIWFVRTNKLNTFGVTWIVEALEIYPYERLSKIIEPKDFDVKKFSIAKDQRNQYGSTQAKLVYDGARPTIQSPWGYLMGGKDGEGIEHWVDTPKRLYSRFEFEDKETVEVIDFIKMLSNIEDSVSDEACKRSQAWFGEDELEDIDDYKYPLIRYRGDNKDDCDRTSAPHIRLKVPRSESGRWRTVFKDAKGEIVPNDDVMDRVRKGCKARVLLQTCPVYVMNKTNFGIPLEAAVIEFIDLPSVKEEEYINTSDDDDGEAVAEAEAEAEEEEEEEEEEDE